MNAETRPMGTAVALRLPADARELRDLATFIATSRLIPAHFQKSPADCWMVMDFCREKGLNFFATIGHCSIVRNNLFFDGQLCGALLNISDFIADHLNHEFERDKDGNAIAVITSARLRNETTPRTVRVELAKVKTENKVWTTQPEQQLCYSGNRIWGRRHLPEVLLGMTFTGETIDVTPNEIVTHEVPIAEIPHSEAPRPDVHSEETTATDPTVRNHSSPVGDDEALAERVATVADSLKTETTFEQRSHAEPVAIALQGDDAKAWGTWATMLIAYIRAAPDLATVFQWKTLNDATLMKLHERSVSTHKKLIDQIEHNIAMRREQDDAE